MPPPDRILIFCPHPDDVELFLGGTMLKHLSEGAAVKIVMMTYGEKGSILSLLGPTKMAEVKQTRIEEIEARLRLIPSVGVAFLNLPDRDVRQTEETVRQAIKEFDNFSPTCVYLPEAIKGQTFYAHPDHLATGLIAETAAARLPARVVHRYYHSRQPNILVDVSRKISQGYGASRLNTAGTLVFRFCSGTTRSCGTCARGSMASRRASASRRRSDRSRRLSSASVAYRGKGPAPFFICQGDFMRSSRPRRQLDCTTANY
jgi:LmbE family N-acetylglucosaminyl deacetylase